MGVRSRIIGISILFTENERRVFLEAGGDDYMEKCMHPERFIPILQELDNQWWMSSSKPNQNRELCTTYIVVYLNSVSVLVLLIFFNFKSLLQAADAPPFV